MKSKMKINIIWAVFCSFAVIQFIGCSEWTEQESLTIKKPDIEEQNPALYAEYLENLKQYKNLDHKIVCAWFDNEVKTPATRAHHLDAIPDSVDVVFLMYPDGLADWEISEMEAIRNNKGTRTLYTISYPEVETLYQAAVDAELEEAEVSETETAGFAAYLAASVNDKLALADKYNYDGICVLYKGSNLTYLTESEYAEYETLQEVFFSPVSQWYVAHQDKILMFEGYPQNIVDKDFLSSCKYIIINNTQSTSSYQLTFNVKMAMKDGVPTDRFIVSVSACSLDPDDVKTGYFTDQTGNAVRALTEAANWVITSDPDFNKAGMGIYDIQNDYYNTSLDFEYTRKAIEIMNPSPKN